MVIANVGKFSNVAARAELAEIRTFSKGDTISSKSSHDTLCEIVNPPSIHSLQKKTFS